MNQSNESIDFFAKSDIQSSVRDIQELLKSGIFFNNESHIRILQKSVFIHIMILLRDLLEKSKKHTGKRVSFTDDIEPFGKVKDVTDLVKFVRDAVCHLDSDNHKIDTSKISFCTCIGKGNFMKINDRLLASDYDDDICFFFGESKLYLKRHIIRAFNEAKDNLSDYLN